MLRTTNQEPITTYEAGGDFFISLENMQRALAANVSAKELTAIAATEAQARFSDTCPHVWETKMPQWDVNEDETLRSVEADLFASVPETSPPLPGMGRKNTFGHEGWIGTRAPFFK